MGGSIKSSAGGQSAKVGATLNFMGNSGTKGMSSDNVLRAMNFVGNPQAATAEPLGFDMGTKWGEAKESRVIEVEFEKGLPLSPQTSITLVVNRLSRWVFRSEMRNK